MHFNVDKTSAVVKTIKSLLKRFEFKTSIDDSIEIVLDVAREDISVSRLGVIALNKLTPREFIPCVFGM